MLKTTLLRLLREPRVWWRSDTGGVQITIELQQWLPLAVFAFLLGWYLAAPVGVITMAMIAMGGVLLVDFLWARAMATGVRGRRHLRFVAMQVAEQIILTVSENGYGKRTSSYEYRTTGRGGKGIVAMAVNARNGKLIAAFPVAQDDEIMLVTDGGQLIRCPVGGIRIAGRGTQGVIVFNTAEDERVVSVEHIGDVGEEEESGE